MRPRRPTLPAQQNGDALAPEPWTRIRHLANAHLQGRLFLRPAAVVPARTGDLRQRARASPADSESLVDPRCNVLPARWRQISFLITSCRICLSSVKSTTCAWAAYSPRSTGAARPRRGLRTSSSTRRTSPRRSPFATTHHLPARFRQSQGVGHLLFGELARLHRSCS